MSAAILEETVNLKNVSIKSIVYMKETEGLLLRGIFDAILRSMFQ